MGLMEVFERMMPIGTFTGPLEDDWEGRIRDGNVERMLQLHVLLAGSRWYVCKCRLLE